MRFPALSSSLHDHVLRKHFLLFVVKCNLNMAENLQCKHFSVKDPPSPLLTEWETFQFDNRGLSLRVNLYLFFFHQGEISWRVGCYQINPTTQRGQRFFILNMLVLPLIPITFLVGLFRIFEMTVSIVRWFKTAWPCTLCWATRAGSPPSEARWDTCHP